jgi:hypothetical protein
MTAGLRAFIDLLREEGKSAGKVRVEGRAKAAPAGTKIGKAKR